MIFELAKDLADALAAMRKEHPKRRMVDLLSDAIRRDIHFIQKHRMDYPQALFQCAWNHGWWYDCPDAAKHYEVPEGGWKQPPPWERPEPKLFTILEHWHHERETRELGFHWLRTRRPPPTALGSALKAVLRGHQLYVTSVAFSPDGRASRAGRATKPCGSGTWNPAPNSRRCAGIKAESGA